MNGFATVPIVVICFLILTDLMRFCYVLCDWSFQVLGEIMMDEGIRSSKSLSLGMPMAPQGKILRRLKRLSLGMPPSGIPSLFQQPSVFYLKLYFYSSHIMSFAWSILYDMSLCLFCFESSILAIHTYLREPKFCYDLLEWLICFT